MLLRRPSRAAVRPLWVTGQSTSIDASVSNPTDEAGATTEVTSEDERRQLEEMVMYGQEPDVTSMVNNPLLQLAGTTTSIIITFIISL